MKHAFRLRPVLKLLPTVAMKRDRVCAMTCDGDVFYFGCFSLLLSVLLLSLYIYIKLILKYLTVFYLKNAINVKF